MYLLLIHLLFLMMMRIIPSFCGSNRHRILSNVVGCLGLTAGVLMFLNKRNIKNGNISQTEVIIGLILSIGLFFPAVPLANNVTRRLKISSPSSHPDTSNDGGYGDGIRNWFYALLALICIVSAYLFRSNDKPGKYFCETYGRYSWFQGHALWHVLSSFSVLSVYLFLRSEKITNVLEDQAHQWRVRNELEDFKVDVDDIEIGGVQGQELKRENDMMVLSSVKSNNFQV